MYIAKIGTLGAIFSAALLGISMAQAARPHQAVNHLNQLNCDASEVAKFNGALNAWVCAKDETSGGPTYIVKDANGVEFGTVLGINTSNGLILPVRMEFQDSSGQLRTVVLRVLSQGFSSTNDVVGFDELGCEGNAFVFVRSGFPDEFDHVAVLAGPDFSPNPNNQVQVYIATDNVPQQLELLSTSWQPGECANDPPVGDVVPAELVVNNLQLDFPPPFTLEIR